MSELIYFKDLQYAVRLHDHDEKPYVLKWSIYEIAGWDVNGDPDVYLFHESFDQLEDLTEDISKAVVWAELTIRWDGCSHLYLHDHGGYFHVCGISTWQRFDQLVRTLFRESHRRFVGAGVNVLEGQFGEKQVQEPGCSYAGCTHRGTIGFPFLYCTCHGVDGTPCPDAVAARE